MPSSSPKQARTMRAAAHDPAFAAKLGIPQKVASDFVAADQEAAEPAEPPEVAQVRSRARSSALRRGLGRG